MKHGIPALISALLMSSSVMAAEVEVQSPYARATAPGQMNSAAFMQLNNTGEPLKLVAASSPAAEVVELHTHTQDQGVMRMRRIDAIELPAGGTTELAPGGLHIMLIGLPKPLKEGSMIDLELTFDDGDSLEVEVPVKQVMPAGMQMKQGHGHVHGQKINQ
ncbi:copper chaperone PCu(A)C [Marinobacterium sp. AK62]|uniref:Copper chaperone PCu(A)C n=1 Tax=Marinobacterium alkalitolerans TaxID=1542925 RepID=A0ABS3ZEA0_9GAMM|nr:copper chaperone PCu(A)C [Marinobacterium alkalitolerans]MBP0050012.1 copper chaperone PCu(A)C [Marinobacterium alkalitolerans]